MKILIVLSVVLLNVFSASCYAVDASELTKKWMHTPFGLYLSPQEAYELKATNPDSVIFIDVRSEAELHTTGMPSSADVNIPYRFESNVWKMKKMAFSAHLNGQKMRILLKRLKII